jgi:hypothetical protein
MPKTYLKMIAWQAANDALLDDLQTKVGLAVVCS